MKNLFRLVVLACVLLLAACATNQGSHEAPKVNPLSLKRAREFLRIETQDGDPGEGNETLERQNEILLRNLKDGVLSKWIQDMKAA